MKVKGSLTVFFEGQFWVGIFESSSGGKYEVARVIFGPEPKDGEILDLINKRFNSIVFGKPVSDHKIVEKEISPKRLQRKIKKELQSTGIGTKAQNAIKKQREGQKLQRKEKSKEMKKVEKDRQFEIRQQKRKDKKRGH
ncbi:Protein of unknown function [Peptoclostridium litorale DSM 5388]|uniref:DUF2992 family protein n=1 Tax=Peptoclostridium litorale DSM 5388 TaxID=1121324 RepID=A0A069RIS3_PEPLI|nr:YjdF family protein [Peptoclostridium litorale]KDR96683.1 hypothetical protein CLIT_2c02890 [Peptoclostridium litorale DSM 5388]SIN67764.1 Protein of unknown function [Peptoclostridium litorale DSM 5388]